MMKSRFLIIALFSGLSVFSQEVRYTGTTLSNPDYHHGQLPLAVGVHNIQVMRANRDFPDSADGFGWTYNHAPNLAFWNGKYYLQYLVDPIGEHIPPGKTFLVTSADGYQWGKPEVLFPDYRIPDGYTKAGVPGVAQDWYAVMHQRMGFFTSKDGRLITVAFYGIAMNKKDGPNDGNGIGRVVREIYKDGSFGPIYFIRYNNDWNEKNTSFPFYKRSKDKGFINACDELMADPLMMQQWVEEADRDDPLIPLKNQFKAFSYYHLSDGRVVGLWKHGLSAISTDGGKSWPRPDKAPGIVTKNSKMWGQKTADGRYAIVYNPSEFRWPLAVSVSEDGLNYSNLLAVNGEISAMRYGGNYKSYGPQYVRGIQEVNGQFSLKDMWLTYSMNKEDIWVSKVPVPVSEVAASHVNDDFEQIKSIDELVDYNLFSPVWAPITLTDAAGDRAICLSDRDPYDYANVTRVIPASELVTVEMEIAAAQADHGMLQIEFQDGKGTAAARLLLEDDGILKYKDGYRNSGVVAYEANQSLLIKVVLDVEKNEYHLTVNDKVKNGRIFVAPVDAIQRIVFRTGEVRRFPDIDTPTDQDYDLPKAGEPVRNARFYIKSLKSY